MQKVLGFKVNFFELTLVTVVCDSQRKEPPHPSEVSKQKERDSLANRK